ncbi:MAG: META domain-containing protein [Mariniphaga sp.]
MKMYIILFFILLSFVGCKDEGNTSETRSIKGKWEVISIIENEIIIPKEFPNDSIVIDFQDDDKIFGNSLRNLITGSYKLYENDSIWISSIGGTEINETIWEKKFKEIMPKVSFFDLQEANTLVLLTSNSKSRITLKTAK